MRVLTLHPKRMALTCALILTISGILAFVFLTAQAPPPSEITLAGISPESLKARGITLAKADSSKSPAVGADEAAKSIAGFGVDAPLKEIVLAKVSDKTQVPLLDRNLWVISLDVEGSKIAAFGPPGSPDFATLMYELVFVDPDSGKPLYSTSAARTD